MKGFRVHFCLEALETPAIDRHCKNAHLCTWSWGLPAPSLWIHWSCEDGSGYSCQLPGNANVTFLEDDFHLEINEEVYHQCVMQASQVSRTESAPENAVPASNGQTSRAGRTLRLPHRVQWHRIQNLLVLVGFTICVSWTMSVSLSNLPVWVRAENKTLCKNVL